MSGVAAQPLFHLPESTERNVGEMEPGDLVDAEYGLAAILSIEASKWRFSEKPKLIVTFRDYSSGKDYTRSYFPWSPIKNNHAYEARFNGEPSREERVRNALK